MFCSSHKKIIYSERLNVFSINKYVDRILNWFRYVIKMYNNRLATGSRLEKGRKMEKKKFKIREKIDGRMKQENLMHWKGKKGIEEEEIC